MLNGVAGTLIVANTFVQQGLGFSTFQTGLLSITYLITVLLMIRVGERFSKSWRKKADVTGYCIEYGRYSINIIYIPIFTNVCCRMSLVTYYTD